jgi:hypothetical protein
LDKTAGVPSNGTKNVAATALKNTARQQPRKATPVGAVALGTATGYSQPASIAPTNGVTGSGTLT